MKRLTQMVREYIQKADIGKSGSCHLFRHACATLMLENGAVDSPRGSSAKDKDS